MRRFIRHPADIPIAFRSAGPGMQKTERLQNIGAGGLCFRSRGYIEPGNTLRINISVREPPFEAVGVVAWCSRSNEHFDVGVQFDNSTTDFAVRMVEQVCHVEQYRRDVLQNEGRTLSGEQAAREWIAKHASDFPR